MDLYLQFGYGMMEHCRHLIESWGGGSVIISPRDLSTDQIQRLSNDIHELGGMTLLDPQFYDPRADYHTLIKHDYWPEEFDTNTFLAGPPLTELLTSLIRLNNLSQTDEFILPGLYCERVDDDWLAIQEAIIEESENFITDKPRIATICLSAEATRFEDQIEVLLNASENWSVEGYYVVVEHPDRRYLSDDPMWLNNLLTLCSGLKLHERQVIVGYSNHQMLCLACAHVDAIASGSWLNVRSFGTEKFQEPEPGAVNRRAKWYYCPQTLSEYKLPFLDMAFRGGILGSLRAPREFNSGYTEVLFSGAQPSTTVYSEQQSFRHYLMCLHHQGIEASRPSFQETIEYHQGILNNAERMIRIAHRAGTRGQDRDFGDIIDVNRAAIDTFADTRGFVLDRLW